VTLLTALYAEGAPKFGWKAAKAQPRGPTRPIGQLPETEPCRPVAGQVAMDMVDKLWYL
jgi:hypothetical protein